MPNGARCTCEIKSRIAMLKAAFNKKTSLFRSKLDRCFSWNSGDLSRSGLKSQTAVLSVYMWYSIYGRLLWWMYGIYFVASSKCTFKLLLLFRRLHLLPVYSHVPCPIFVYHFIIIIIIAILVDTCVEIAQSVWWLVTGWTVGGSNPSGGGIFRTRPDRFWPPRLLYNGYPVSFPG
jgi:hypothetical protein